MNYELIIFDCDGTLVNTEPVTDQVFEELMIEYGAHPSDAIKLKRFSGSHMGEVLDYIATCVGDFDRDQFVKTFRKRCNELFEVSTKAIPDVEPLLSTVIIKKCVGSNAPHSKIKTVLKSSALAQYFDESDIHSAYDVQKWKPDPTLYLHIANIYNIKPSNAIVIEDSVNGAMGAVNANIDVVVYNPRRLPELNSPLWLSYSSMPEINDYLRAKGVCQK